MENTHQILFGSANSFKSYCVTGRDVQTDVHTYMQTERQTEICSLLVLSSNTYKTSKGENFFSILRF